MRWLARSSAPAGCCPRWPAWPGARQRVPCRLPAIPAARGGIQRTRDVPRWSGPHVRRARCRRSGRPRLWCHLEGRLPRGAGPPLGTGRGARHLKSCPSDRSKQRPELPPPCPPAAPQRQAVLQLRRGWVRADARPRDPAPRSGAARRQTRLLDRCGCHRVGGGRCHRGWRTARGNRCCHRGLCAQALPPHQIRHRKEVRRPPSGRPEGGDRRPAWTLRRVRDGRLRSVTTADWRSRESFARSQGTRPTATKEKLAGNSVETSDAPPPRHSLRKS